MSTRVDPRRTRARGRLRLLLAALALLIATPAHADDEPAADAPADGDPKDGDKEPLRFALAFSGTRWVPSTELAATDPVTIAPDGTVNLNVTPDDVVVPLFGVRYWISDLVGLDLAAGFNVETGSVTATMPNADPALTQRSEGSSPATLAFAARLGVPLAVYSTDTYRFILMPEIDVGYASKTISAFALSTSGEPLDMRLTGFVFGAGGRVGAELNFGFIGVRNLSVQSAWGARFETRRRVGRIGDAEVIRANTGFGTSWYGGAFDIFVGSIAVNYYL